MKCTVVRTSGRHLAKTGPSANLVHMKKLERVVWGLISLSLSVTLCAGTKPPSPSPPGQSGGVKWITFPDPRLEVCGLPWFKDNTPELWRLPGSAKAKVPKAVWARALAPDGGRIRFSCNTTRLDIRAQTVQEHTKPCFFDVFVNGQFTGSGMTVGIQQADLVLFEKKDASPKDITIYLPHREEVRVFAIGVDSDVEIKAPAAFAAERPIVCYGSSVLQGSGAKHPGRTYPAALARRLNLDFVNLGFGGAGKGEPEVVSLVNQLEACCYLFDLGKSYGTPDPDRFSRMLDTIRKSHPDVPIFCVTPIYSIKEAKEPAYLKRSNDLRVMMRQAAATRRQAGDKQMHAVEGLALCGEQDKANFSDPLHPNDQGNEQMAERLAPQVKKAVSGK